MQNEDAHIAQATVHVSKTLRQHCLYFDLVRLCVCVIYNLLQKEIPCKIIAYSSKC